MRCSVLFANVCGDYIEEANSNMWLVIVLYVTNLVSICFLHVVEVSDFSICSVFCAFSFVLSRCFL